MTPTPSDAAGLPQPGALIAGKYQVEAILGQGGMGVVVAARHLALRQRVAIKFLLPAGLRLPGARERFLREAQAAAALQSDHVARVLDVGTLETGAPYLVMEHLSGADLSQLLKTHGSLPVAEAVDILLQACEAIREAHSLGIIHRDLKPQNLFILTRSGAPFVKVLDFGLSKLPVQPGEAPEASLTATELVMGSPQYMSPEQIRSLKHVDARTDIWALGVILYQLLTGRRPFLGDSVLAICASIVADTAPPLATYRPDVPASLGALVRRCLEKNLALRVQTVDELLRGLAPFAPTRAAFPSEPEGHALSRAAAKSSQVSISAIIAPVPTSREESRTTARLSGFSQTQPRLRPRRLALWSAVGSAGAAVCAAAIGGMLLLQGTPAGSLRKAASEATASSSAEPPVAEPPPPPVEEKTPAPLPAESTQAEPPVPPPAPTSAASAAPSSLSKAQGAPQPEPGVAATASPKTPSPPPPPPTAAPAVTSKPDAGQAPKPKPANDLMDRFD
jgi:eukaryotic-like serine/threonine-protein kinase